MGIISTIYIILSVYYYDRCTWQIQALRPTVVEIAKLKEGVLTGYDTEEIKRMTAKMHLLLESNQETVVSFFSDI